MSYDTYFMYTKRIKNQLIAHVYNIYTTSETTFKC